MGRGEGAMIEVAHDAWTIEPRAAGFVPRAREIWRYRRLAAFFGLKALQKLYARTKLGWVWLIIRPLFPLLVKAVVFGSILAVPSEGVPYFLFLVTSTTIWELLATAVMWGTRSLELNRGLIRQVYVPRLILPFSMITPALLTFVLHLLVLFGAIVWYRIADGQNYLAGGVNVLWAVLAVGMTLALALAVSFFTSVPAMGARDVRFTLGYVLGFWVFMTPVMYPLSAVPENWRFWMLLNPMTPIVEAFKFGMLGIGEIYQWALAASALTIIVAFGGGVLFFVRAEADAADRV
jgi:lipopolysaccharide transport system permease protein